MSKCAACGKFVSTADGVKCIKCNCTFEKTCVQLSKTTKAPPNWICSGCISKQPRKDNSDTPAKGVPISSPELVQGSSNKPNGTNKSDTGMTNEMKLIRKDMNDMREEMALFSNKAESILALLNVVNERLSGMESRVSALEAGIGKRLDNIEDRVMTLEKSSGPLNSEAIDELTYTVELLKSEINNRDQEMLMTDVEITGLPEVSGENPLHLVKLVATKLAIQLEASDIVSAQRVGPVRGRDDDGNQGTPRPPRPLALRLARRDLRDKLLREARVRRSLDTDGFELPGAPRRFYINERLTRTNRQLFGKARQEGKNRGWKYVWTRGGRVFARRQKDTEAHRISSEKDIVKVFGTN